MKIAYFDCIAGASGDMILGALVDAGLPIEILRERLGALHLPGFELRAERVRKGAFAATQVEVVVEDHATERHLSDLLGILDASDLSGETRRRAGEIFAHMCEVEASIHGTSPDHVHLHELGAVDTIVDVVGALVGLEALGVERVFSSPLPLGRGFITGAHGKIPLPGPAALGLLRGVPVVGSDAQVELVTPTGAAVLAHLVDSFGAIPPMTLAAIGYGAGQRDEPTPNVLRLLLGSAPQSGEHEVVTELETNIDDMNPEVYDYVMERLFHAGALDVFWSPIQMKKNRPATLVRVLCAPDKAVELTEILLAETSSLGVRQQTLTRRCLPRVIETVHTAHGDVRVKVGILGDGRRKGAPEYEDCRRLAAASGVPLREIYNAAERALEGASAQGA